jgi:demethylmenaquinone methyltransferase / 2-methoxy-6-polyprenyl-1,4-benzoquinol methylase
MSTGNSAPPGRVEEMFDRISGVYDGMNLAISGFQEPRWRRELVRACGIGPGGRALDVACGTGKVTTDLYRASQPGGSALGIDFSAGMIGIARERVPANADGLTFQQGDALALPVDDDAFDAATIAFGMRNLADYRQGFAEMARAVRPGGRVACLEITRPSSRLGRLVAGWFDHIVPVIGRLVGQGAAYAYLVQSTREYPRPERIAQIMADAGLLDIDWRGMSGGIVVLHVGTVPPAAKAPADQPAGSRGDRSGATSTRSAASSSDSRPASASVVASTSPDSRFCSSQGSPGAPSLHSWQSPPLMSYNSRKPSRFST